MMMTVGREGVWCILIGAPADLVIVLFAACSHFASLVVLDPVLLPASFYIFPTFKFPFFPPYFLFFSNIVLLKPTFSALLPGMSINWVKCSLG